MAWTLANANATFTFTADATYGIKLATFYRAGSAQTWQNSELMIWRSKVFATTATTPFNTSVVNPNASVAVSGPIHDGVGYVLTCYWSGVTAGGSDTFNVTVTIRLDDTDDWIQAQIDAGWNGTPTTYAIHALCVLPLAIAPLNQGSDYAVLPQVFGIRSKDPVRCLRRDPTGGKASSGFGVLTTNTWQYPAGRGWNMGVWGYYETPTSEGWMVWVEGGTLEVLILKFEGDGTNLTWEEYHQQQDDVLVGNNGRVLGTNYRFCLRPFICTQVNGWWDIGSFYRQRVEADAPEYAVAIRPEREDYSTLEREYAIFVNVQPLDDPVTHAPGDGKPANLQTYLNNLRVGSGLPTSTPITGIVEAPDYNLHDVGETADGDLQSILLGIYQNNNTYLGHWINFDDNGNGTVLPYPWSIKKWKTNVLDWWTTYDGSGAMRMSRFGYLSGGGVDRLAEEFSNDYYRERTYTITNWNGGTLTATVSGSPSGDGFTGSRRAILKPAAGTRMAIATVSSLGASTVVVTAAFLDYLGATATPLIGDTLVVEEYHNHPDNQCFHAMVNASSYMNSFLANKSLGIQTAFGACGDYLDTFCEPNLQSQRDARRFGCYRDHSTWSKIDPGYVAHPKGAGGDWHKRALRDFVYEVRQQARAQQQAAGRTPWFWETCEDIDETMMDRFDWCWHPMGAGDLWRAGVTILDQYDAIPLYPTVYAGKTMGRGLDQTLASYLLYNSSPWNDPELHAFIGYCMHEWVYGITWPEIGLFEDVASGVLFKDFFDDTQYVAGGGSISNTVKSLRDLWKQWTYAEGTWLLDAGFRYGQMQAPAAVDLGHSTTTTGMAETTYASIYTSYDILYPRATTPRVMHSVWKASDGTILLVFMNWSDTAGTWVGALDLETLGLGELGSRTAQSLRVARLDYTGATSGSVSFDAASGSVSLSVAAFTTAFVTLEVGSSMATIVKGSTFSSTVTANGLHQLVESATISGVERGSMRISEVSLASSSSSPLTNPGDNEVWQPSPGNALATYDTATGTYFGATPQVVKYTLTSSSAAVVAGNALMSSQSGTTPLGSLELTLASGANTAKVFAIALAACSPGGSSVAVIAGPAKAKTTGTVNFGEGVKLSSTAGVLQSAGAVGTGQGWEVCGTATTSASGGTAWINLRR